MSSAGGKERYGNENRLASKLAVRSQKLLEQVELTFKVHRERGVISFILHLSAPLFTTYHL